MSDDSIEQQMWDAFARCVPDEEARRAIAARVIARAAAADPRAVAAREVFAGATPEEFDAAFARAAVRGSFSSAEVIEDARTPLRDRVVEVARAAVADFQAMLDRMSDVFVARLTVARGTLGPHRPEDVDVGDGGVFRFDVPAGLASLGLAARGSADLDAGMLELRVRRTRSDALPPIVVMAVADGKATEPVVMHQGPTDISAVLVWGPDGFPDDVVLGVVAED